MTVVPHIGATLYCRFLINNHLCRLHHSGACLNNNNEKLSFLFFCLAISCPATWSAIFSHRDPDYSLSVRHCYLTFAEHKKDTVSVKKTCTTYPQATSFSLSLVHGTWTELWLWQMVMCTAQRHITSTYFVLIGWRHREPGRTVREFQLAQCERSHWRRCSCGVLGHVFTSLSVAQSLTVTVQALCRLLKDSSTSSSTYSPLPPPITPSFFHFRLKTFLFHKSFPQ